MRQKSGSLRDEVWLLGAPHPLTTLPWVRDGASLLGLLQQGKGPLGWALQGSERHRGTLGWKKLRAGGSPAWSTKPWGATPVSPIPGACPGLGGSQQAPGPAGSRTARERSAARAPGGGGRV